MIGFHRVVFVTMLLFSSHQNAASDIRFVDTDVSLRVNDDRNVSIIAGVLPTTGLNLSLEVEHEDVIHVTPVDLQIRENDTISFNIKALEAGRSYINIKTPNRTDEYNNIFMKVSVYKAAELNTFSEVVGWIYFAAWSLSYYPQVYSNWKRKSVVGFSLDFITLNIVGFIAYSTFNVGLYFLNEIKDEYTERYPRNMNPVKINDVVFAVHALIINLGMGIQCLIYDRGTQRISYPAKGLLVIFALFLSISLILKFCNVIIWLDYLYYCSYVKLMVTLTKYMPQVYLNYTRKSTSGYSTLNMILDFTGGNMSMLQMLVDAFNYSEWSSLLGDPTKFGLGLISVFFDVCFMVQNFILYRNPKPEIS